jgi:acetyl esterase/lipase
MSFMAPAFNSAGVTFVTAGYRLAPTHVFPAALDDCVAAVRWVLSHAAGHGGDAHRLFIGGHSAGGHYAALLAASAAQRERSGLPADALRGCLPLSGVFD